MPSTREILEAQRELILTRLRAREPALVRELEAIDLALGNLDRGSSNPDLYSSFQLAIDAIVKHLERMGATQDRDAIAHAIVEGGWLKGNAYALKNARGSLRYHLDKQDEVKVIRTFPSGRVGLYGWGPEYDGGK